ncbi:glycoside hydrolase family 7 protein [Pelomyxa schiedti]|nr:glycoside hydrolase family 7 protein [Pelomyxa schiedti]
MLFVVLSLLFCLAVGQQVGTYTAENHPSLTVYQCTSVGNCQSLSRSITLDSNWRWVHKVGEYTNCYTGNKWDTSICTDPDACAKNCALEGGDYPGTYGITTSGDTLTLKYVTYGAYSTNIGSRVYLMESTTGYKMFQLLNQEFTFDVDVSQLPCGLNGALYFVEMPSNGGMGTNYNSAGAKYGTGYCDAQCPHDIKWINGEANIIDWTPSDEDPNSGTGYYGTCCGEMDIWESNSESTAYTAHDCSVKGLYRCSGTECGDDDERYDGVCDKDGCDFNSYRLGDKTFYGGGSSFKIDTTRSFSVITQFVTVDNTTTGALKEIRRLWKQDGVIKANSVITVNGETFDSVSDDFCDAEKTAFGDPLEFEEKGGMAVQGQMLGRGVVLVLSLWDDFTAHMLWLDSEYPTDSDPSDPGVTRGPCPTTSGNPDDCRSEYPNSSVKFSKIRFGPLGSTQ